MLLKLLRKPRTLAELRKATRRTEKDLREEIITLIAQGYNIARREGRWELIPPAPKAAKEVPDYKSRPDNTYLFGFVTDNHAGSRYARPDVVESLYNIFELEGVDRVYHAGNWIDGHARFNTHEVLTPSWDKQIAILVDTYPKSELKTYAIWGADHEGWHATAEGVNMGKRCEQEFRDAGRKEWIDIGFLDATVQLKNANSGKNARMIQHPGEGTAYAISYKAQKIVESFESRDKPDVLLIGHYHKMSFNIIRGVYAIQCGCAQEQTSWMRRKGIQAHLGGGICKMTQDPRTGDILRCSVEFIRFKSKNTYREV
jgi:predicted phosphodiesterase